MSQTLYRKYRSQRFAELIGQQSVVRILQNSIKRGRLNHAYLFSGPRGTGKTSIARIFAKALNCLNPQDGDACGVCAVCTAIASGSAVDVIEIDAASNRGIDDIRDLRDRVSYAPLELKYKVYIIDEVHMITPQGFNALLKTLEEPPSHVIFCLCTTEANKLPITILSRCIRFDFQRLPLAELAAHLVSIATTEGFTMDTACGMKLALLAEGSARDAISLLDQLTVYCDTDICAADIDELFQLGDPQLVADVLDNLAGGHADSALGAWDNLLARGVDAGTFLLQLAEGIKSRYLADGHAGWNLALEEVWKGLNLLKYDSFPALLVELTLLQAAAALNPQHGPVAQQHAPAARQVAPEAARPQARELPVAPRGGEQRTVSAQAEPPRNGAAPVTQPPKREDQARSSQIQHAPPPAPKPTAPSTQPPTGAPLSSDEFEAFREEVRRGRLTTYALLREDVVALRDGSQVALLFDPRGKVARQAHSYASQPDNHAVLREAARKLYGAHAVLTLHIAVPPETGASAGAVKVSDPPQHPPAGNGSLNGSGDEPPTIEQAIEIFGAEDVR